MSWSVILTCKRPSVACFCCTGTFAESPAASVSALQCLGCCIGAAAAGQWSECPGQRGCHTSLCSLFFWPCNLCEAASSCWGQCAAAQLGRRDSPVHSCPARGDSGGGFAAASYAKAGHLLAGDTPPPPPLPHPLPHSLPSPDCTCWHKPLAALFLAMPSLLHLSLRLASCCCCTSGL